VLVDESGLLYKQVMHAFVSSLGKTNNNKNAEQMLEILME